MNEFSRIKRLLFSPAAAWPEIEADNRPVASVFFRLVLPLLLPGAVAIFIGYGIVGLDSFILKIKGINWGLWFGVRYLITGSIVFFVCTYLIDLLAPAFSSERNFIRSANLVAYSSIPSWLTSLLLFYPLLGYLGVFGLYGVYLYYRGLPVLKKTPDNKRIIYMLVSALLTIILSWLVQIGVGSLLNLFFGDPYASNVEGLRNLKIGN